MPRPRFEKLPEEKRRAILDAATEAFATHGYHGASYNQIINAAGISKGAMYYYFDDKEDLFTTVVYATLGSFMSSIGTFPDVSSTDAFWKALYAFIDHIFDASLHDPNAMGLMRNVVKLAMSGELKGPVFKEIKEMHLDFSQRMLTVGQSVGAVRDDLPLDLMVRLLSAIDEAGDLWFFETYEDLDSEAIKNYGEIMVDLIRRIVSPICIFEQER